MIHLKGPSTVPYWLVYALPPRDWFYDCTVPVADYIAAPGAVATDDSTAAMRDHRSREYQSALKAVMTHPFWERDGLTDARVVYDPVQDDVYYLFRIANNGTTFLVSRWPLPADPSANGWGWDDAPLSVPIEDAPPGEQEGGTP